MSTPTIAQKAPYPIDVKTGEKYFWCACGKSGNQPFCDGSHAGTEYTPLPVTIDEESNVAWCGCKRTGNEPF